MHSIRKYLLPYFLKKIRFVKQAPCKNGELVPIHISRMTLQHVRWWHSTIQPVIDNMPDRADRNWNWILIAASSTFFGRFLFRRPSGITIGINVDRHFVPIALMQIVGKFPYFIDRKKKSVFIWYLAVAPFQALSKINEVEIDVDRLPKRLGSIALDTAVVYSMNHLREGRTSLHAAEEGGDKLLQWYVSRGMEIYPEDKKLHVGLRRLIFPSDGRYCYFTEAGAIEEIKEFSSLRKMP